MGKLTLSVDPSVVKRAKDYAARSGTSVSSLVESYLDLVSRPPAVGDAPVTPLLARLRVELKGVNLDPVADAAKRRRRLLRRVTQGEADVREGRTVPQEKVFKSLRARLAGK